MGDLLRRYEGTVAPMLAFDTDIHVDHAQGPWVYDAAGNKWADFACGTAVANLGHNHPEVISAAQQQLSKLAHAGCVFRYDALVDLAENLRRITPDGIEMFGFANSGAEAVEASVKLARYVTNRQGVIAFRGAFHGRTMGSVAYTTSNAKYRENYHPILGSVFVTGFPHPYRWGMSEDEATDLALDELARKFKHEVLPHNIAAFLVEPVQGEGGYYPAPPRFLQALRDQADEHGIMLVFDEVQTGFGRTANWFAADHFGIRPDILVMGKGIANGLPLSSYGASAEVINQWPVGAHGTTFGGNPVACAAASKVIEVMEPLLPYARDLSKRAFERFEDLKSRHQTIGDVRGLGLMVGVELVSDREARTPDAEAMKFISAYGIEHELIVIACGPDGNIIRFIPPLTASMEELDAAIGVVDSALSEYEAL